MAEEKEVKEVIEQKNDDSPKKETKEKWNIFSRIWNGLVRFHHGGDFEKRLQHISKEEATILSRMKKRSKRWRRTARNIIAVSVLLEIVAIGYAIMTTRSLNMEWQMRALRVLPMFLLPGFAWALYYGLRGLTGIWDQRDHKALERLRGERQAKINELKERTNYYNTQQLIQRYDPDPAAKAAAASVLASKLGAEVSVEDSHLSGIIGKSSDIELLQQTGLRRRNQSDSKDSKSPKSNPEKEPLQKSRSDVSETSVSNELIVERNPVTISSQDGGWIARLAALLVGEDPTQSYALICGNCHMHNGLARKEDFLVITYYCPHCHTLNKPRTLDENSSCLNSPNIRSPTKHRVSLNKSKKSGENSSDKMKNSEKSSDKSVVENANLVKESSKSKGKSVSGKKAPMKTPMEETEKKVAEDLANR